MATSTNRATVTILDGTNLTIEQLVIVTRARPTIAIAPPALARAAQSHQAGLAASRLGPVYSRTTGVGANRDQPVTVGGEAAHGQNLIASHATQAGPELRPKLARAMMIVRLSQLLAGGSGVSPGVIKHLADAISRGVTPPVRRYSAIGTGDMGALGTLALCLTGHKPWIGGRLRAVSFAPGDAMAFMSSSAATVAEAALSIDDLRQSASSSLVVAALSFVALGGSTQALATAVHDHQSDGATALVARTLRYLLANCEPRRIQDPYALRTLPQVLGTLMEAINHTASLLKFDMNRSIENPLTTKLGVFHNGNFNTSHLALALDQTRAAAFGVASLSGSRLAALMEPAHTGLRPFLATGPGAASGALMLEYVAASAMADIRGLANPVTLASATLSRGLEEHASFATQAAWRTAEIGPAFEVVVACELVAAIRAIRQQSRTLQGPLADIQARLAQDLPSHDTDSPLADDLEIARRCLPFLATAVPYN